MISVAVSDTVIVLERIKFWNFGLDFMAMFTSNILKHYRQPGKSPPKKEGRTSAYLCVRCSKNAETVSVIGAVNGCTGSVQNCLRRS